MISSYVLRRIAGFDGLEDTKEVWRKNVDGISLRVYTIPNVEPEGYQVLMEWYVEDVCIRRARVFLYSITLGSRPLHIFLPAGVDEFLRWCNTAADQMAGGNDTAFDAASMLGTYYSTPMVDFAAQSFENYQKSLLSDIQREFTIKFEGLGLGEDPPVLPYQSLDEIWVEHIEDLGADPNDDEDDYDDYDGIGRIT